MAFTCRAFTHTQVLHGGENLLDKVEALKARSAATKAELEVAARQKEEQARRLEQLQLERLDLNTQYSTLEVCRVAPTAGNAAALLALHCTVAAAM